MSDKNIILASGSKYRKRQLASLGLDFLCITSDFDESKFHDRFSSDWKLCAQELAKAKAKSVFELHRNSIVIGGDQIACFEGQRLGKTGNLNDSVEALLKMSGGSIQLFTAICILQENYEDCFIEVTRLKMKKWSREDLERYVEFAKPIDCAGSFKIELGGVALFESIETEDYTAIEGIPLNKLSHRLEKLGIELWSSRKQLESPV